jgi:hypothetical protein
VSREPRQAALQVCGTAERLLLVVWDDLRFLLFTGSRPKGLPASIYQRVSEVSYDAKVGVPSSRGTRDPRAVKLMA